MGALTLAATISGFMAAQFAISLWSEQFAEFYSELYSESFYLTVEAPVVAGVSGATMTDEDRAVVARQCGFANGDPMALSTNLTSTTLTQGAVTPQ
jgi:hypothetical protein